MDPGSLPHWAQAIFYIIVSAGAGITAVLGYSRKKSKETEPAGKASDSASVISASFIDSKLLKELIEALRESQEEQGRDSKKTHQVSKDLKEAINELNESVIVQTDTTMNLVRFINREVNRNRMNDANDK